jgi:hypothetical protein
MKRCPLSVAPVPLPGFLLPDRFQPGSGTSFMKGRYSGLRPVAELSKQYGVISTFDQKHLFLYPNIWEFCSQFGQKLCMEHQVTQFLETFQPGHGA